MNESNHVNNYKNRFLSLKNRNWTKKQVAYYILISIGGLFVVGTFLFLALIAVYARDLPDPNNLSVRAVPQTTTITDRTGKSILYQLYGQEKRTIVELNQISPYIIKATLIAEDKDFYTHNGFAIKGIFRAVFVNLLKGQKVQGGSTITQQLVKNSILTSEKTFSRKIKELILAIEIERRFSKEQILKLYLNEIPYGSTSYGVETAAQSYFGKAAKDLNLKESVLIAAIVKAPTYYSPYGQRTEELKTRMGLILDAMLKENVITKAEYDKAKSEDVLVKIKPKQESIIAPHFVFYVRDQLAQMFGEESVLRDGLKVTTSLDLVKQNNAETALKINLGNLKKWNATTAAMAAIDPKTGDVLAMIGSADYFNDSINGKFNSLLGFRQPGSSIKPIVYAAAFEKGYTPSTVVYDAKTVFPNLPTPYIPSNYDGRERGPVTFKEALAGSLNIPAVQAMYLVGIEKFQDITNRLGYSTFKDKNKIGLSVVLGGGEVKPLEHIAAFSVFANSGSNTPTRIILKVEDSKGNVLFDADNEPLVLNQVMEPEVARQITDILSDNNARAYIFGSQNYLTLGASRPIAAKSGTTNSNKDGWTIGYTPSLVAGVWVGNATGKVMKPGADGSKVAAPIWNEFMKLALANTPVENFVPAKPVRTGKPVLDGDKSMKVGYQVDKSTGKLATALTPPEYIVTRGYGQPHSILFFVDKNDPRGDYPKNPASDPQYSAWETAAALWNIKMGNNVIDLPPTTSDDVHVPENNPIISFTNVFDGQTVNARNLDVSVSTNSPRGVAKVVYAVDNETITSSLIQPFGANLVIPNRFEIGFHKLSATASDDVGNSTTISLNFNLTAEPKPSTLIVTPKIAKARLVQTDFPVEIELVVNDPLEITSIDVEAVNNINQQISNIGSLVTPTKPVSTITWLNYPGAGTYSIKISTIEKSGSSQEQQLTVVVK